MKTRLALVALLALSVPACAASQDEELTGSADSDLSGSNTVTDFMSGGEFACNARDNSGREVDISISIGVPRKDHDVWQAPGSYEIVSGFQTLESASPTFRSTQRGRPIPAATGRNVSIRSRFGGVSCVYSRTSTDVDGHTFTRTFEGPVVRYESGCFDERFYLQRYPDVGAAVASGNSFLSGRAHWEEYGRNEGREGCGSF